ncbi:MAG TPA: DUF302 domain-containing protein [Steroidobacteraceae bacterium]|nr:DUF302 domain-containing protein [Steroidobacteraceae bacterium]
MDSSQASGPGVIRLQSHQAVGATLDRLESLLKERGVLIFARIDFSGDAAKAGLALLPEQQLVFGNPKAGTPLMAANAVAALDLPIRVICWQDRQGRTWLAYNDPVYIVQRHALPADLAGNLAAVVPLIERAASGQ